MLQVCRTGAERPNQFVLIVRRWRFIGREVEEFQPSLSLVVVLGRHLLLSLPTGYVSLVAPDGFELSSG
jgi:hypothetical protein